LAHGRALSDRTHERGPALRPAVGDTLFVDAYAGYAPLPQETQGIAIRSQPGNPTPSSFIANHSCTTCPHTGIRAAAR
jgi:hypothetical protein